MIFLNWSLTFYGTQINPSDQLPTTTPGKLVPGHAPLHPTDDSSNNNARSRSTNLHNFIHTRHREKNRKNKQQQQQQSNQNHYYIKQHYYPYDPLSSSSSSSSSSQMPSIHDDQYLIEVSDSNRREACLTYTVILFAILHCI